MEVDALQRSPAATNAFLLLSPLLLLAVTEPIHSSPSIEWVALSDDNLGATLEAHHIMVIAGCTSDHTCDNLGTELSRAAKILGRVASDDASIALCSAALHRMEETASIAERYRFAAATSAADDSVEPRCETKVVVNGLETDFGLSDDGSPPQISKLARGLVTAIMREIVPGAKALQENKELVIELTTTNYDQVIAQTEKDSKYLLINFYQPPVSSLQVSLLRHRHHRFTLFSGYSSTAD